MQQQQSVRQKLLASSQALTAAFEEVNNAASSSFLGLNLATATSGTLLATLQEDRNVFKSLYLSPKLQEFQDLFFHKDKGHHLDVTAAKQAAANAVALNDAALHSANAAINKVAKKLNFLNKFITELESQINN